MGEVIDHVINTKPDKWGIKLDFDNVSSKVLIDPSLIMTGKIPDSTVFSNMTAEGYQFFVPKSFLDSTWEDDSNPELGMLIRFFSEDTRVKSKEVGDRIARFRENMKYTYTSEFEPSSELIQRYRPFRASLSEQLQEEEKSERLLNILIAEWIFLAEHSFISSRIRKQFDLFVSAGAIQLSLGKRFIMRKLDGEVRRTLHKSDVDVLTKAMRLTALGKWTAAGVTTLAVSHLFGQLLGGATGLVAGVVKNEIYVLFDP